MENAIQWWAELSINEQKTFVEMHPYYRVRGYSFVNTSPDAVADLYSWLHHSNIQTDLRREISEGAMKAFVQVCWKRGMSVAQIQKHLSIEMDLTHVEIADLNRVLMEGAYSFSKV